MPSGRLEVRASPPALRRVARAAHHAAAVRLPTKRLKTPCTTAAQRLKAAGKPAKMVIVAWMHKLLSIMNTMLKSNTPGILN